MAGSKEAPVHACCEGKQWEVCGLEFWATGDLPYFTSDAFELRDS